jgi:hypothetical protein
MFFGDHMDFSRSPIEFDADFQPIDLAMLIKIGGGVVFSFILAIGGFGMIVKNLNATNPISVELLGGFKATATSAP